MQLSFMHSCSFKFSSGPSGDVTISRIHLGICISVITEVSKLFPCSPYPSEDTLSRWGIQQHTGRTDIKHIKLVSLVGLGIMANTDIQTHLGRRKLWSVLGKAVGWIFSFRLTFRSCKYKPRQREVRAQGWPRAWGAQWWKIVWQLRAAGTRASLYFKHCQDRQHKDLSAFLHSGRHQWETQAENTGDSSKAFWGVSHQVW